MKSLNFDTGVVEFSVGSATISFNPTDVNFIERIFRTFDAMDEKHEQVVARIEAAGTNAEVFAITHELEDEMRGMIDDVFCAEVSEKIFGGMSVYAIADGLPLWANLLLAVIDETDSAFTQEQKKTDPRIQKYLQKFNAKKKK